MNRRNRKFAESDWVNSTILDDISQTPASTVATKSFESLLNSRIDLENGCVVTELVGDTIPAELMDTFEFKHK